MLSPRGLSAGEPLSLMRDFVYSSPALHLPCPMIKEITENVKKWRSFLTFFPISSRIGSNVIHQKKVSDKQVMNLKKSCFTAFMSCISFVLSTFVSFPFVVPFQHFCNVICAVLIGPVYGFISALITGLMRMALTGRPITAVIGAVIGSLLAGILYLYSRRMILAVAGEIIGTGILSAIASYYAMGLFFDAWQVHWYFYIPLFLPATVVGSFLGYAVLLILKKSGSLAQLQQLLESGGNSHE